MGIRTDLLVTEEIAESSDLRATPFEFERAKRVEAALSILEGKWKIVILNRLHILHVDTTFLIHNSFHPRKTVQEQRLPYTRNKNASLLLEVALEIAVA